MTASHPCPVCDGGKKHIDGGCRTCGGTGIVQETPAEEAATVSTGYDPREINGL